jgi:hypothetical protein
MSDLSIEAPDADAAEQHQDVVPDATDADDVAEVAEPPLEADEADAAEQARDVSVTDDDEYR